MKEKKAITKKIDESTLRNIIYKKILKELNLKEWRGEFGNFGYDGDVRYVRPNGEPNSPSTGLDVYHPYNNGKRTKGTARLKHEDGSEYSVGILEPGILSHGKAKLISKTMKAIDDILLGNEKVEWTDSEMEDINNVKSALYALAIKTKEEGNEKRGYNGPEEESDEEEINESLKGFFQALASEANPEQGQVTGDQLGSVMKKMDKYTVAELRRMLLNGYKVFNNPGGWKRETDGMKYLYKIVDGQGNTASYIVMTQEGQMGIVKAN